jgi:hypothetical protein
MMGVHKYRSLCPKKKTLGQKAVGCLARHPWLFILGFLIVIGIVTLMMWQVNAQADYLLSYGSG